MASALWQPRLRNSGMATVATKKGLAVSCCPLTAFNRGLGLLKKGLGIYCRFGGDPYKNYMAVSKEWGPFGGRALLLRLNGRY